jgi:CRISPR/Cas system-associated protein endoribonuclease Cas2
MKTFDLEQEHIERIKEAERRHREIRMLELTEDIRDALFANNALMMGRALNG